jgi:DNA-binding FrmR family transcriptional regulator
MKKNLEAKNKITRRLKIIEGQVRGVQSMVENGKYCIDIITQTSAIKNALSGIEDELLKNHLSTCVMDQIKAGKETQAQKENNI